MKQSETLEVFLFKYTNKTLNLDKKEAWRKSESGREDSTTVVAQASSTANDSYGC